MSALLPLLALSLSTACKSPPQPGGCGELVLDVEEGLTLDATGCASGALSLRAVGDGELSASLEDLGDGELRPVVSGSGVLRALVLEGQVELAGEQPLRWWRQGYQSWSWSGVSELAALELDDVGLPLVGGDGDALSVVRETPWSSWWLGLLGRDGGASLLMGVTAAERSKWTLSTDGEQLVAVWGGRGEALAVDGRLELDPVWVGVHSEAWTLHQRYADAVAARTAPRPLQARPPVGWATWTVHYEDIDEEGLREDLAAAEQALADAPAPRVFQVDDGWQVVWGDWTANERFPSGMEVLATDIAAAGFTPGLWMAPFYVHRDTDTYQDNPDWWVRDAQGEELSFSNLGTGDYAVLDASHPDARAWMAQQVEDRVAEGWTYLKLDFLYAGAQEGQRHLDVSGTQALQLGLRAIREAAGDDAWILACGAPMLPSVGFAESFRSGADIAFTVQPDPDLDSLRWQTRATAARAWQGGRWWHLDSDQIMLRAPFDDANVGAALVAAAVSGGAWMLGDPLDGVPARSLEPELVDALGEPAVPEHPLLAVSGLDGSPLVENAQQDDRVPARWVFSDGRVALLNLGDQELELSAPAGRELLTGASQAQAGPRVLAPWSGELWVAE